MMGPHKFVVELQEVIAELKEENEKLRIENGLLRESSEEQRKINAHLRLENKQSEGVR